MEAKANKKKKQTEPKKMGRKSSWTDEKVEKICSAIAEGRTYKEAFTIANVPKSTFYERLSEDTDFAEKVKKAESEYNEWYDTQIVAECKRSLVELIRGYEYDETTVEDGIDARTGKPVKKTKVVHKRVSPSATAIIFALCNRDPENWKNRINNELSGKVETEAKTDVSLTNVPDDLLEKVIESIKG